MAGPHAAGGQGRGRGADPHKRGREVAAEDRPGHQQTLSRAFKFASKGDVSEARAKKKQGQLAVVEALGREEDGELGQVVSSGEEDEEEVLENLDDLPGVIAQSLREKEVLEERKKRKGARKKPKKQIEVDPSKKRSTASVFFRPADTGEDPNYVYCRAQVYEGQRCEIGRVRLSKTKNGMLRLRAENCSSHLDHCHADWWEVVKKAAQAGESATQTFDSLCNAAKKVTVMGQTELDGFFKKSEEKYGLVEKQLALLCTLISTNTSFNFMNNPMFKVFLEKSGLDLESGKTIQRLLFPLYIAALRDGEDAIKNARAYSVGFDYWTAMDGTHYLGVTYHYTDEQLMVHSRLLDLIPCDASATGILSKELITIRVDKHFDHERELFADSVASDEGE